MTAECLLSAWEQGARRHPIDRALLMFSLTNSDLPPGQLADVPLGVRNAALMKLHRDCFGNRLLAWLDCRACGERMEFELDATQLPSAQDQIVGVIEVDGHGFEPPTSRHLARLVNSSDDPETVARQLLRDCAESAASLPDDRQALTELLHAVETVIEDADPWANIALDVCCPACGQEDEADFDIASYLWNKIEHRAQYLLDDIHVLAQSYGWTETDILTLSETRRAAYVTKVQP